jgi:hypothetical protein
MQREYRDVQQLVELLLDARESFANGYELKANTYVSKRWPRSTLATFDVQTGAPGFGLSGVLTLRCKTMTPTDAKARDAKARDAKA